MRAGADTNTQSESRGQHLALVANARKLVSSNK